MARVHKPDVEDWGEVEEAHLIRALDLIADSWENDDELTIEDMTVQLEQTIEVVNNRIDFKKFLEITHLDKREKLN